MPGTSAQAAFVRTEMLPAQDPPRSQTGLIRWLRENLFSSWLNGILTVLALYLIWTVLHHLVPWLWNSVWVAGSLTECRAVRDATVGPNASSACFAVLTDRWHQLVFGYYPRGLYWRPILALLIFLAGMLPVLFTSVPRKMFIITAAMPFLCQFLIWGGSVWGPITVALGFALGYAVWRLAASLGALTATILTIVLPLLYWIYGAGPLERVLESLLPLGIRSVESRIIGGFLLSTTIGLSAILLSLPLGILLALGRQSDLFIINKVSVAFIETIRGVPLIVWLFTAQLLLNYFLPPGTEFDLTLRVIIMVTLFSAAYIAEVVRGGLAALPKGQYEGADSLGLNYWQSMQLIILPQALKISIPGIVNTFIGLFKDTTLVLFIGLYDPLGISNAIRATTEWNGIYWELYVFIALMFFIACFSMGRYSPYLEKKLRREHR